MNHPLNWSDHYSERMARSKASAIRELLAVTAQPEMISFAGGIPAPEAFPLEAVAVAMDKVMREQGAVALQYGPTEGYMPLKEQLADMYRRQGVPATPANILLTGGAQQGLDLVGRILVDPGDRLLVEAPTYVGALQAWSPFAPQFISAPSDSDGLQTGALDELGGFKLAYLVPNFENPTGVTMSLARRREMLEYIHAHDGLLVEDDPYRRLRYSGEDVPGLVELEGRMLGSDWNLRSRIIHLGTFSKTLAPGLRVGWALAPESVIRSMVLVKQGLDLQTSNLNQMIASELIADGTLEHHLPIYRDLYRQRRDVMLESLEKHLAPFAGWTRPDGGLFVWCTLNGDLNTQAMLGDCVERKVAFVPGGAFYADGRRSSSLRLNFSAMPVERIRTGVERIREVVEAQLVEAKG